MRQILFTLLTLLPAAPVLAQSNAVSTDDRRFEMMDHYQDQRRKSQTLFYSAPHFHLIPQRNTVTLTGAFEQTSLLLGSEYADLGKKDDASSYGSFWELEGYEAAPLVAFAADKFGIGFGADVGEKSLKYRDNFGTSGYTTQSSQISYSGLGTYIYYIPSLKFLPRFVEPTLIGGYKTLNVIHYYDNTNTFYTDFPNSANNSEEIKYRYDVKKIDLGLNMGITLAKHFIVFPWINYQRRVLGPVKDGSNVTDDYVDGYLELDRRFLWQAEPTTVWGLDFAVSMGRLNIHLGGLFGIIANLNGGSDRIQDESVSVSATYNIKSR